MIICTSVDKNCDKGSREVLNKDWNREKDRLGKDWNCVDAGG